MILFQVKRPSNVKKAGARRSGTRSIKNAGGQPRTAIATARRRRRTAGTRQSTTSTRRARTASTPMRSTGGRY